MAGHDEKSGGQIRGDGDIRAMRAEGEPVS
jgi:hypothetical protein